MRKGRVEGEPTEEVLAMQELPERGEVGRTERREPHRRDRASLAELSQQCDGERVGQPIHPRGEIASLDLRHDVAAGRVENRGRYANGVQPGTDDIPEDGEARSGPAAELLGRCRISPSAPPADHYGR